MLQNSSLLRKPADIAILGESAASAYLSRLGYRICERNWRIPGAEIDIVARDGDTLVCIEVKTRSGPAYGSPEDAVGREKLRHVIRAAQMYRNRHSDTSSPYRIDVVAVDMSHDGRRVDAIRHFRNVTM